MKTFFRIHCLLPAFVLFLASACGESVHITNNPPTPLPTPDPDPTDYYVSPAYSDCKTEVKIEQAGGMYNILGRGYDATGEYLAQSSLRPAVVDLYKQYAAGLLQTFSAPASSMGEMVSGTTPSDFLNALMAGSGIDSSLGGDVPCFNGTLNSLSSDASYLMSNNWIRSQIARVQVSSNQLPRTLSDEFISDTTRLKPAALVEKYGTHFIVSASLGLSVRTTYSAYVDAEEKNKINFAYKGFQNAEAYLADRLGTDLALTLAGNNNFGATMTKVLSGGRTSLIEYDATTGKLGESTAWQESMESDNLTLITLSDGDLKPISDAIENVWLRRQVEDAVKSYIQASKVNAHATVPLLQNSNGKIYRYVTGFDESIRLEEQENLHGYGMLGSLYRTRIGSSIPFYSYIDTNGNQILSLIQPTDAWTCIGYVMPSRTDDTISLYEITDGTRYAYTIEAANSYGANNEWHPTGAVFHLIRP